MSRGGGSLQVMALQAQLQNTLEQSVLAAVAYGAWLALASPGWGLLVPLFAVYFVAGRCLFFAGFPKGAAGRALGFGLTFYPSVALLVLAVPPGVAKVWLHLAAG